MEEGFGPPLPSNIGDNMLNPFRLINYTLIALVMFTSYWWAGVALASLMVLYSLMYYYSVARVMFTLDQPVIAVEKTILMESTLSVATNLVALVALYKLTPYAYVSFWCAPWIVIAFSSLTFAYLVLFEYIEITEKDEK